MTPGFRNTAVVFVDVAGDILPLQDVHIVVVPGVKTMTTLLSFEIVLHHARANDVSHHELVPTV